MLRFLALMAVNGCCMSVTPADTYQLCVSYADPSGIHHQVQGSAECFESENGTSLLATTKHLLDDPKSVFIAVNGDWILADRVLIDDVEDLAIVEIKASLKARPLAEDVPENSIVNVDGYGELLRGGSEKRFRARVKGKAWDKGASFLTFTGLQGEHVIPGDSGGGVGLPLDGVEYCAGIVSWHDGSALRYRKEKASMRIQSGFVSCKSIAKFVYTQYGRRPRCGPQGCPIQVRPAIRQPMIGIGIPTGPPQVVGEVVPYNPPPQTYVPESPRPIPQMQIPGEPGPPGQDGRPGPAGPQGPRGEPGRSVQQAEVEAVVNAWLDSNIDRIRGSDGEKGPKGDPGLVGVPDNTDIKNWLAGALQDPASREELRNQLRDLLKEDPRVKELLDKIEKSAANSAPIELELVGDGTKVLATSRIIPKGDTVVVESESPDGVVLGSRSYRRSDGPIRLNLRSE